MTRGIFFTIFRKSQNGGLYLKILEGEDAVAAIIKAVEDNKTRPNPLGSICFILEENRLSQQKIDILRTEIQNKKARKVVIHGACITVICR